MEGTAATIGAWLLTSLFGGGVVATAAYLMLREKLTRDLEKTFATKAENHAVADDLNNLGSRVNGLETVAIQARDNADANSDRLSRVEESWRAEQVALSRTLSRIDKTMDGIDNRAREDRSKMDRAISVLDQLEKRMDRETRG